MRVYANEVIEYYVAVSLEEAQHFWEGHLEIQGMSLSDVDPDYDRPNRQIPDDYELTIRFDDRPPVTRTAQQWAVREGPGFLCSTEY